MFGSQFMTHNTYCLRRITKKWRWKKKRIQVFGSKCLRKLLRISYLEHKTNDWVRSKLNFLAGPQERFLATLKRRELTTTTSPEPSFGASWRLGDAVVGRGNACWTISKSGHPCPGQSCSQGPPAGKAGRGSLLNRLSCLPGDTIGQGAGQNWPNWTDWTELTELNWLKLNKTGRKAEIKQTEFLADELYSAIPLPFDAWIKKL